MTRADVLLTGATSGNFRQGCQSAYMVYTASAVYYFFISGGDTGLHWVKSTDNKITWTDPATIVTGDTTLGFSVWFDKWTEGNSGTIIHIGHFGSVADAVTYVSLDTASDTLGTPVIIFDGASTGTVANTCIAISRMRGGNLICMFDIDGGTEVGTYRSIDAGLNWTARSNVGGTEGADYFLLFPGYAADNQDGLCLFWDRSASEISRKMYGDSGDAWTEDSIVGSMTAIASSTASPHFAGTVDHDTNKIYMIAWNARDTANADLRFFTVDDSSDSEGTPVVSNGTDDQTLCALARDSVSGDLYAYYGGKSDGSENVGTAINIYYKVSTDDGATWGAETQLTTSGRDFTMLYTSPIFTGDHNVSYQSNSSIDNMLTSALLPSGGGGDTYVLSGIMGG